MNIIVKSLCFLLMCMGVCAARDRLLFAAVSLWNENPSILNGLFRTTAPAHGAMPTQA